MTALARPKPPRMTADEFIAWAMEQPEGERHELEAGEVVSMAPERAGHWRVKARVVRALTEAIEQVGLECEVFSDRVAVEVSTDTVYEPDAMVLCGAPVFDDTAKMKDPVIVVEVLSPSTGARDAGAKLVDYFGIPSLRHYLLVSGKTRTVIHHARSEGREIATRIVREGVVRLDPPGVALDIGGLFQGLKGNAPR
jgi:Uma2 family endonuclease